MNGRLALGFRAGPGPASASSACRSGMSREVRLVVPAEDERRRSPGPKKRRVVLETWERSREALPFLVGGAALVIPRAADADVSPTNPGMRVLAREVSAGLS